LNQEDIHRLQLQERWADIAGIGISAETTFCRCEVGSSVQILSIVYKNVESNDRADVARHGRALTVLKIQIAKRVVGARETAQIRAG